MSSPVTPTLFKKSDVCKRLDMSPRTLEGMVKADAFPPPVRMGRPRPQDDDQFPRRAKTLADPAHRREGQQLLTEQPGRTAVADLFWQHRVLVHPPRVGLGPGPCDVIEPPPRTRVTGSKSRPGRHTERRAGHRGLAPCPTRQALDEGGPHHERRWPEAVTVVAEALVGEPRVRVKSNHRCSLRWADGGNAMVSWPRQYRLPSRRGYILTPLGAFRSSPERGCQRRPRLPLAGSVKVRAHPGS